MNKHLEITGKLICFFCFLLIACDTEEPIVKITTEDFTACIGEETKLTGKGFNKDPAKNIVKFGDAQAIVLAASSTEMTVKIPENASGKITVKTGNVTAEGPIFTPEQPDYYIKFKANGEDKTFSVCTPQYMDGSECVWGSVTVATEDFVFIRLCYWHETVTPVMFEGWKDDQLLFAGANPYITFGYKENGKKELHTEWAAKTGLGWPDNGSELKITAITKVPTTNADVMYIIHGNFTCYVSSGLGDEVSISEGEFNVPVKLGL